MTHRPMSVLFSIVLTLIPLAPRAQVEKLTEAALDEYRTRLPQALAATKNPHVKDLLERLRDGSSPETRLAIANAVRVANDLTEQTPPDAQLVHYAVPAMSDMQRLPNAYPTDGRINTTVRIIAARDEYEPGSFVLCPFSDLGKVSCELGAFTSAEGTVFPKDNLDLKIVKVWYQNGNGWYSYFGDTAMKLVPELLLNDEDLIDVRVEQRANFARMKDRNGSVTYRWISAPFELDSRYDEHYKSYRTFSPMKEGFADAPTLRPVLLNAMEFKQFFLTAHVTADVRPGTYQGSVRLLRRNSQIGLVPVTIRVLPFTLPSPKTYFDPTRDFLIASYNRMGLQDIMEENGGDRALAEKQLLAILKNLKRHNQLLYWLQDNCDARMKRQIELLKEAGMSTNPLLGGAATAGSNYQIRHGALMCRKWFDETVGHHNVFLGYGDEPGADWLVSSRPIFEAYQREGFKFILAGGNTVFYKTGYLYDFHNIAKAPEDSDASRMWNEVGHAWVAWYANQHVGPENPAFNRRQYGMAPYLANYSAACNYAHHLGPYNDNSTVYRPMVFAYGCYDGLIDTLQWEGFREGIDDIRYSTCLKVLAQTASKSPDISVANAGRKALQFFAELDAASADLSTTRLEMIHLIMKLQDVLHVAQ